MREGKVIADETAKQLEQVVESSKAATAEVYKIAVALEADAATMTQINQGVEQINSVVQTNSATSQQCAAASQEMSDQAGNVRAVDQELQDPQIVTGKYITIDNVKRKQRDLLSFFCFIGSGCQKAV